MSIKAKKGLFAIIFLFSIILLISPILFGVMKTQSELLQNNIIEILPAYEFHKKNATFEVNVHCIPNEPIKAYEFQIHFDPTKLQANYVTEGDFFAGYPTFFSPNVTIDNTIGTITKVYDLIIGQGNITTPGVFVKIGFTALDEGVSPITLVGEGITNETQYLEYTKFDAATQAFSGYPPWDVNQNGKTDVTDISLVMSHYGETCNPGDEAWDIRADGKCDILDISCVIKHYGESTMTHYGE